MVEPTIDNIISLILNDVGSNISKEATDQAHTSKPTTPETKDIVLPKIIAKHLFPTNEDEQMIELVKNMQVNDSNIRDALKKIDKK